MVKFSKLNLPPKEEVKRMTLCEKGTYLLDNPKLAENIMNEYEMHRLIRKYNNVTAIYDNLCLDYSEIDERDMSVSFDELSMTIPSWECRGIVRKGRYGILCATDKVIRIDGGMYSLNEEQLEDAKADDIIPVLLTYMDTIAERNSQAAYRYLFEAGIFTEDMLRNGQITYSDICNKKNDILDCFHFQEELDDGVKENVSTTAPYIKLPLNGAETLQQLLNKEFKTAGGLTDLADF